MGALILALTHSERDEKSVLIPAKHASLRELLPRSPALRLPSASLRLTGTPTAIASCMSWAWNCHKCRSDRAHSTRTTSTPVLPPDSDRLNLKFWTESLLRPKRRKAFLSMTIRSLIEKPSLWAHSTRTESNRCPRNGRSPLGLIHPLTKRGALATIPNHLTLASTQWSSKKFSRSAGACQREPGGRLSFI